MVFFFFFFSTSLNWTALKSKTKIELLYSSQLLYQVSKDNTTNREPLVKYKIDWHGKKKNWALSVKTGNIFLIPKCHCQCLLNREEKKKHLANQSIWMNNCSWVYKARCLFLLLKNICFHNHSKKKKITHLTSFPIFIVRYMKGQTKR